MNSELQLRYAQGEYMKFVVAIEMGSDTQAFGVTVPDLPGCHSAGDTLDEAFENAREAIDLWCATVIEDGKVVPLLRPVSVHQRDPAYAGWIFGIIEVDVERYLGPAEKINITLPKRVLVQVDEYARAHGESRSGFLARVAMEKISAG